MEAAPLVLESFADYVKAGAELLRYFDGPEQTRYDGVLLACFGDPALYALKEIMPVPVIGIAEAALSLALLLGFKFSILAASRKAAPMMESLVKTYGLESRMASVESIDLPIESFLYDREQAANPLSAAVERAMSRGADVLVLGCAGMTMLEKQLEARYPVKVIDPVRAGITALTALLECGLSVSKAGLYEKR
jgi:allantoin racemase